MSVVKSKPNYVFRKQQSPGHAANETRRKTVSYPFLQSDSTNAEAVGCNKAKNQMTLDWKRKKEWLSWFDPCHGDWNQDAVSTWNRNKNFSLDHYFLCFVPETSCKLVLTLYTALRRHKRLPHSGDWKWRLYKRLSHAAENARVRNVFLHPCSVAVCQLHLSDDPLIKSRVVSRSNINDRRTSSRSLIQSQTWQAARLESGCLQARDATFIVQRYRLGDTQWKTEKSIAVEWAPALQSARATWKALSIMRRTRQHNIVSRQEF